ncbi:MAG: DNA polymerase I [Flavobacteriales bacterium]
MSIKLVILHTIMTPKKKLFLLDAYALIFRAYFGFINNPRINSKGLDTSAIFGFTNTLIELIRKEKPTHIAVCFDRKKPTFRHEQYKEYKAHREATPEGIITAKPYIDRLLDSLNIQKLYMDGYEADDVIGTLAKKAEQEDFQVYMMTSDKDFAQLVSENIFMYRPGNKWSPTEVWGIKEVLEKFQIQKVPQVIDFLGMMGDAVDNIPGLPGVGKKTAQKFIAQYGSMEALLANTHEIKGKLREKVEGAKELGILSKQLATIETHVPIAFEEEKLKMKKFNIDELEFKTILQRVLSVSGEEEITTIVEEEESLTSGQLDIFSVNVSEEKEKKVILKDYNTPLETEKVFSEIEKRRECSFQILCNNLSDFNQKIIGVSFSYKKNQAVYFPSSDKTIDLIRKILLSSDIKKIGFDIKNQIKILRKYNITEIENIFDISIAHYLLQPDMRHDIDLLAENYLGQSSMDINSVLGKGKNKRSMSELSKEKQTLFCSELTDIQLQLYSVFTAELKKLKLFDLFQSIEMPLLKVLSEMELEGISLDTKMLSDFSEELSEEIIYLEKKIYKISGEEFNLASPKQMGEILFEKMKITEKVKKTKTGQYSTSEETLSKLKGEHPIIDNILEYRGLQKLLSTYVKALPLLLDKNTGKIHTTFNQSVAATGRLSSVTPNLQNIPIRTEKGRKMRKAFIPRNEQFEILAADYSQIELRIIASLSADIAMLEAFNNGIDIHSATAAKVYKVEDKDVTREMRSHAKMVNFGIIYGISAFGLSQRLGIKRKEAAEIIENYFIEFPKVKEYMDLSINKARDNEFVETILGRRRYLKDINSQNGMIRSFSERNAINTPIQGSAADIIKKAMIDVQQEIKSLNLESRMLLQVHDELVFDMKKSERKILMKIIKEKMEQTIILDVPLVVDMGVGENWLIAH